MAGTCDTADHRMENCQSGRLMSAQNIYDDPDFFAGYARLPRSEHGLPAVFEWPAFQRLLPPSLQDMRVLDLGCGLGYFAREARARGAREVVGVDISDLMLEQARASGPRYRLQQPPWRRARVPPGRNSRGRSRDRAPACPATIAAANAGMPAIRTLRAAHARIAA